MGTEITPEIDPGYPPDPLGGPSPALGVAPLVIEGRAVDGRTAPAKRFRALCQALTSDLGGQPSTAQALLIRCAATLSVQCETIEHGLLTGAAVDADKLTKLINTLGRVLGQLGLQRQARDVTPRGAAVDAHTAALIDGDGDDA
jgi:hypothetical protein